MKKQILIMLTIASLLSLLAPSFITSASASYSNWYSNTVKQTVDGSNWQMASTANNTVGQLVAGNGEWLYSARFYIQPTAAMTGTLYSGLWEYDGTDWDLIENASNTVDCSEFSAWAWANFSYTSTSYLNASRDYVVGAYWLAAPSQPLRMGDFTGSGGRYKAGAVNLTPVSSWSTISFGMTAVFVSSSVYGGGSGDGSIPLPTTGDYDYSDMDVVIAAVASFLIPLILFLLPAFLLGTMTKWSKWPIMIGLTIGSGLVYLFLGPQYLWLVFLVVIGLIGMAYQSVRGGG